MVLKKKTDRAFLKARKSYERFFNEKARYLPVFLTEDRVYLDKPSNWTKEKIDVVMHNPSRNLVFKKDGPFIVLQIRFHTVAVNVNGIHNVVSIDGITLVKTAEVAMGATEVERHDDVKWEARNTEDEYVVECIVRQKDNYEGAKYLERWYGQSAAKDT